LAPPGRPDVVVGPGDRAAAWPIGGSGTAVCAGAQAAGSKARTRAAREVAMRDMGGGRGNTAVWVADYTSSLPDAECDSQPEPPDRGCVEHASCEPGN